MVQGDVSDEMFDWPEEDHEQIPEADIEPKRGRMHLELTAGARRQIVTPPQHRPAAMMTGTA